MKHITQNGLDLIKHFEGFRPLPYLDPVGILTIGYGHVIHQDENENFTHLTEVDGEDLLRRDVGIAETAVSDLITVPLEDYQFDALVSFTFNLGAGALKMSTLRKRINAGQHDSVPNEIRKWVYAGGKKLNGLIKRREAEARMYVSLNWKEV